MLFNFLKYLMVYEGRIVLLKKSFFMKSFTILTIWEGPTLAPSILTLHIPHDMKRQIISIKDSLDVQRLKKTSWIYNIELSISICYLPFRRKKCNFDHVMRIDLDFLVSTFCYLNVLVNVSNSTRTNELYQIIHVTILRTVFGSVSET